MKKMAIVIFLGGAVAMTGCAKNKKIELLPKIDIKMDKMFEGPTAEEKVNKQIGEVLKARDEVKALRETAALWDLAKDLNWDSRRVLAAVLDYASRLPNDEEQVNRYQRLLDRVYAPKTSVVDVAAERLEHAKGKTDEVARSLLRFAVTVDARERRASYGNFAHYMEARQSQPPAKLVLWMYENDPGAAMLEMLSVFASQVSRDEAKVVMLAERTISDSLWKQRHNLTERPDPMAVEAMGMLVRFKPWWVRLYVAEIASRYPALRGEGLMQRLWEDENELVKQVARAAK